MTPEERAAKWMDDNYCDGSYLQEAALVELIRAAEQDAAARVHRERNEDWKFVPDEHGGHMLSKTGDKWYPESFLRSRSLR